MIKLAEKLFNEGRISETAFGKLKARYSDPLFSLNLELKTLLFAGVMLLAGGLGIVIYQNIDTIGHLAIIIFIAAVSFTCFAYCFKNKMPYSQEKATSPSIYFEYVLLLACLTFASFNGYLQYQYSIYGSANGASFLLPAILFFAAAYFFDHIGVLSLAITCFAAFAGITIAPTLVLSENDFSTERVVSTGLLLGASFVLAGRFLGQKNIKKHFTFTYYNFAFHILFVSCLAGLFTFDQLFIFFPILAILVLIGIRHSMSENSFYFLLFTVLYGYIGLSYFIGRLFIYLDFLGFYFGSLYFIGSAIFMIRFLKNSRKKMKAYADL